MSERLDLTAPVPVSFTVNGERRELVLEPRWLLSDVLRHRLGLTGTHVGCEHGVCGACTILLNGAPVRSCLMFGVQARDADIVTVEGLESANGELHPLQEAFRRHHGLQCGFCTTGFLMALIPAAEGGPMTEEDFQDAVAGQLCRCTGYVGIVEALREVTGSHPEPAS
jgi:aerobic-type carbon monoxide dehydrogenase small subunit (CoxS/CutS family)